MPDRIQNEKSTNYLQLIGNRLIFPSEFRNKQWGEQFGEIQKSLRDFSFNELTIDFSKLTWIDPLPLLSLQLSLAEFEKLHVNLLFPKIESKKTKSGNLLAFLYSERFLEQFPKDTKVFSGNDIINDFSKYECFVDDLNYSNCSIIKAKVVDIDQEIKTKACTINDWVNNIIENSQFTIKNKIESYKANEVISRLKTLLSETISNVYEHAHPGREKKLVGFYVRFRKGLGNTRITKKEYSLLEFLIKIEHSNSPKLHRYFIDHIFNFIEIFVIDSGCGLWTNYFSKEEKKFPFREAWRLVIAGHRGKKSKNKTTKKTQYGGLHYIYKKLGNNYICARDESEWIGHDNDTPIQEGNVSFYEVISNTNVHIEGFAIVYRLTWDVASDDNESSWQKLNISVTSDGILNTKKHPYYQELQNSIGIYDRKYEKPIKKGLYYVEDNRFSFSNKLSKLIYKNQDCEIETCIFFPARFMQKNEILETIKNDFREINCTSKCLIVCDILVYEANLYQLAIENADFSEEYDLVFFSLNNS